MMAWVANALGGKEVNMSYALDVSHAMPLDIQMDFVELCSAA